MENLQSLIESFTESTPAVKMANGTDYPEYKVVNRFTPYFTPEEKDNLDGYYSDIETEEEDKLYDGLVYESNIDQTTTAKPWMVKVKLLQMKLTQTEDPEEIEEIKERLLALGWNPEIEYNLENSIKAANRFTNLILNKPKMIIEDATEWEVSDLDILTESEVNAGHKPVYICFVNGGSTFSNIITTFTNGEFSHAMVSLDENMNNLYSFNLNHYSTGPKGGFSIEQLSEFPRLNRFSVYAVVLDKKSYNNLKRNLNHIILDSSRTTYNIFNILTFPFKHLFATNKLDYSMICSQFVDSLLKIANMDITNLASSKVSPQYLYDSIRNNNRGYKIFDGIVGDYNPNKTRRLINKIIKSTISKHEGCIIEARSIPIEVSHNGDVLLSNPFPNFDEEYYASHKLLMQYEKSGNIDGMKYELCRLFYMNYILESRLYHNKILSNKEKNIKTRARILNDFNKYLKYVLSKDKSFNFAEYYEKSPFYAHTYKITKPTVLAVGDLTKYIASMMV